MKTIFIYDYKANLRLQTSQIKQSMPGKIPGMDTTNKHYFDKDVLNDLVYAGKALLLLQNTLNG